MLFGKSKRDTRAVFIGMDGVPFELIEKYMNDGTMKNLKAIADTGLFTKMKSSVPDISSVAWSCFNTGYDPSHHGIFGFMDLDRDYNMFFPNFLSLKKQTLWEKLADYNKKSTVINIPQTYPVRPFNGSIISGFISIDWKKSIHPSSLLPLLEKLGYKIDIDIPDTDDYELKREKIMEEIFRVLSARINTIKQLFRKRDWDLFIGVITETDRLHHYFFDSFDDNDKWTQSFCEVYSMIDEMIGELAEQAGTENFYIMSDHGFTVAKKEVLINNILIKEGLLKLKKPDAPVTGLDPENTKAFSLDPARIYINDKRFSKGFVKEDKDKITDYLAEIFSGLEYEGKRVFMNVFRRNDIYKGPLAELGADLLLVPNYGFDPKASLRQRDIFVDPKLNGMHSYDNAFFVSKTRLELPDGFSVKDPHWILFSKVKI